ncbi:hypothetical protein C8D87_114109 [Lentzea atacamensis]|uniref:Uncharacterized protein n=1 Tax=Lentzea atacamensis TaxID=531938 RepID=A0ABX9DWM3_9PSEU|nr:hypothetical protein [Lentzea atacamensis]RAS59497.1 hypothetical protein C8D87_114109 [Lentzea atacamensis]
MGCHQMHVQGVPDFELNVHIERGVALETTALCNALVELGMAFPSPVPEFPDGDHLDRSDFRDEQPITSRAREYLQALELVRADHGDTGMPGIPTHKLASGDGWHVPAHECAQALAAYDLARAAGAEHPAAFADDFIPFLRTAARYQGFRVF